MDYVIPGTVKSGSASTVQKNAMGSAMDMANKMGDQTYKYPDWYGSQMQAPAQTPYYNYQATAPMQTTSALSGGDYNALQSALIAPIQNQWNQDNAQIRNIYGANGLYGSSGQGLMSGVMNQAAQSRDQALSTAVANRYALQMQDLNRMDDQNLNAWKTNFSNNESQNAYNLGNTQWQKALGDEQAAFKNSQLQGNYNYGVDQLNYQQGLLDNLFGKYTQLAGLGNTANSTNLAAKAQEQAQSNQLWNSLGSAAGSFLGSSAGSDLFSKAISGAGDWISGLWN